jgi:hypothetical protein
VLRQRGGLLPQLRPEGKAKTGEQDGRHRVNGECGQPPRHEAVEPRERRLQRECDQNGQHDQHEDAQEVLEDAAAGPDQRDRRQRHDRLVAKSRPIDSSLHLRQR